MSLNDTPRSDRLHIAIFGRRNAGKSSLLNAFTGRKAAIVSETAGTTTDPVYKSMEIHGLGPCVLIDTAGFDDNGPMGELRVQGTEEALKKTDVALVVIAADAGYEICLKEGLQPDLLLGDFDSMEAPADFPHILRAPVEKDDTDTMLAIKTGLARGYQAFLLYGCLGGRLDHTYANLQALLYLARHGAAGFLLGGGTAASVVENGELSFPAGRTGILSVFCPNGEARGVTLRGLRYPLRDAVLTSAFPLGVSNHIRDTARITAQGTLLVMLCRECMSSFSSCERRKRSKKKNGQSEQ